MFESVSSATIKFQRFAGQQDTDSMHMLSYLYKGFKFYIHTYVRMYSSSKVDGTVPTYWFKMDPLPTYLLVSVPFILTLRYIHR